MRCEISSNNKNSSAMLAGTTTSAICGREEESTQGFGILAKLTPEMSNLRAFVDVCSYNRNENEDLIPDPPPPLVK